jgi:hypothetical protein
MPAAGAPQLPPPTTEFIGDAGASPGECVVPARLSPILRSQWRMVDPWATDQQMEALFALILLWGALEPHGRVVKAM